MKLYANFDFFVLDIPLMSLNIKSIIISINSELVKFIFSSYCSILFAWLNLSKTFGFKLVWFALFILQYVYYINLYLSNWSEVESQRNLALKPLRPDRITSISV